MKSRITMQCYLLWMVESTTSSKWPCTGYKYTPLWFKKLEFLIKSVILVEREKMEWKRECSPAMPTLAVLYNNITIKIITTTITTTIIINIIIIIMNNNT